MAFLRPTAQLTAPQLMLPAAHLERLDAFAAVLRNPQQLLAAGFSDVTPPPTISDGIAIVTASGCLMPKPSWIDLALGAHDVNALGGIADQLREDDKVNGVLFAFDSPGGMVTATPENAAKWRALAAKKPVLVYVDGMACSGAYWISAQATVITSTPTGQTGSIGVICTPLDESGWYAKEGYERKVISTGSHKGAFTPGAPITDDQVAHQRAKLDTIFAMFKEAVLANRPSVSAEVFDGDVYRGEAALKAGLVDAIVPDMAGALRILSEKIAARQPSPAPAEAPAAKVPNHGHNFSSGAAEPKAKTAAKEIRMPTPKNDADAWRIWTMLSGPTRTRFYSLHDQAIWRGKREADRGRRRAAA